MTVEFRAGITRTASIDDLFFGDDQNMKLCVDEKMDGCRKQLKAYNEMLDKMDVCPTCGNKYHASGEGMSIEKVKALYPEYFEVQAIPSSPLWMALAQNNKAKLLIEILTILKTLSPDELGIELCKSAGQGSIPLASIVLKKYGDKISKEHLGEALINVIQSRCSSILSLEILTLQGNRISPEYLNRAIEVAETKNLTELAKTISEYLPKTTNA